MPLAIAFDRIDAEQKFAGDGFVSEPLQPEIIYDFLLRRRHQAAPFVSISLRHTFSRNKKRANTLYLQGLRALIPEEMPSPGPIDSAKFRAKGGGGLGPCACRDLTRPSLSGRFICSRSIDNLSNDDIIKIDNIIKIDFKEGWMMSAELAFAATEAKQKLGEIMDAAQKGPVVINKSGRPHVVMVSVETFNKLQEYEDRYWAAKAEAGVRSGFMGPDATMKYLQEKLNG